MSPAEARKHRVRNQLIATLQQLREANRVLYLTEDRLKFCLSFSEQCKDISDNIDALRAGIEETNKLITQEAKRILYLMENPSAEAPPDKRPYYVSRHTPLQLHLEREGLLKLRPIPLRANDAPSPPPESTPPKIPTLIPFTLTKRRHNNVNKTKLGHGIIPI
jgi:hypothetical protein